MTKAELEEMTGRLAAIPAPPWLLQEDYSEVDGEVIADAKLSLGNGQYIASYDHPWSPSIPALRFMKHAPIDILCLVADRERLIEALKPCAIKWKNRWHPNTDATDKAAYELLKEMGEIE